MAILKQKTHTKARQISVRLDADLAAQIDALRTDAAAAGFDFDVSDVCAKALASAVKAGRAELAAARAQGAHTPPAVA